MKERKHFSAGFCLGLDLDIEEIVLKLYEIKIKKKIRLLKRRIPLNKNWDLRSFFR